MVEQSNGTTHEEIMLKLGTIEGQNSAILQRLGNMDDRLNLHSQRLGSLERWRSYIVGALAIILFMVSWLMPTLQGALNQL